MRGNHNQICVIVVGHSQDFHSDIIGDSDFRSHPKALLREILREGSEAPLRLLAQLGFIFRFAKHCPRGR